MTLAVAFHEAADLELAEAAAFYERECPGLGAAFLDEVQTALTALAQFPEGSPLLRGRLRRKVLLRFPYALMRDALDLFNLWSRCRPPRRRHRFAGEHHHAHLRRPVSRLLTSTDPLGRLIWYTYDFLNRLSTVADPRQGLTPFTYDANGNILTVQDALGQTTTHARGDRRGVGSLLDPEGVRLMPRDKGRM